MTGESWGIHTLYRDVESLSDGIQEPDDRANFHARARTIAQALHLTEIDIHLQNEEYDTALDLIHAEWKSGDYPPEFEEHAIPRSDT